MSEDCYCGHPAYTHLRFGEVCRGNSPMDCSCLKYRENRRLAKEGSDWDKLNDRVTALEYASFPAFPPAFTNADYVRVTKERDELKVERDDLNRRLNETYMERDEARRQRDDLAHELDEIVAERDKLKLFPHSYCEDRYTAAVKKLHDLKEKLKDEEGRHQATAAAYSSLMGKLVEIEIVAERDALKAERDGLLRNLSEITASCSYWKDQYSAAVKELHDLKEKLKEEQDRHQATAGSYQDILEKYDHIIVSTSEILNRKSDERRAPDER